MGWPRTLRSRTDITVVDVTDLRPPGIAKIADVQPDVVLVDVGQTSLEAFVGMVRGASGLTRLVAFALDETDDHVFACTAAGFCSYVARDSGAEEFYRTLVDVMQGRLHCVPHVAATMFARLGRSQRKFARATAGPVVTRERSPGAGRAGPPQQGNCTPAGDQHRHFQNHMHNIL
jgi:DNA-binding NarL/FixJ family response regulator